MRDWKWYGYLCAMVVLANIALDAESWVWRGGILGLMFSLNESRYWRRKDAP